MLRKILGHLSVFLPALIIGIYTELRSGKQELDLEMGGGGYVFGIIVFLGIVFWGLVKFFDFLLKKEEKDVASMSSVYTICKLVILLTSILIYDIVTSSTNYGQWNNGIVKAEGILERITDESISDARSSLEKSLAVSRLAKKKEPVQYALELSGRLDKIKGCLKE